MNIAVLGNEGSWYVDRLSQAARSRGHECQRVDFCSLTAELNRCRLDIFATDNPLSSCEAVIVRTMPPGSLEQVVFRMDVLLQLEQLGCCVLNAPRAVECAVDKFLTSARLAVAGLPVPRTMVCENHEEALAAFSGLGGDVVVKPLFGAEGRGILRVSDIDLAFRTFRTLQRTNAVLYLQEYIPHAGYDIRVLILNGQVLGGIKRSNPDDFRTNVSRNGRATVHCVSDQEAHLALQSAQTIGACFAGIDLLYDPEGNCLVVEVNAVPGWRAFEQVTGMDVATKVIQHLEQRQDG